MPRTTPTTSRSPPRRPRRWRSRQTRPPAMTDLPRDLPQHARERLVEMRERKLWTRDLSVAELLLVREAGFEPVGMVMGTSIYQVAPKIPRLSSNQPGCELVETTKALYHARELAMNRMEEEAEALDAAGLPGARRPPPPA